MIETLLDLDRLRLTVAFQRVVDLRTGEVVGYEALGRVRHRPGDPARPPDPAALIEEAHRAGRLADLERLWQRRAVVAFAAARPLAAGLLFLNLDPRVAADPCFRLDDLSRLLWEHGISPRRVVLELTEAGAGAASPPLPAFGAELRRAGFCVALDDLGAGGASLARFVEVRPDVAKLDRALGQGLATDSWRQRVTASLVECCGRLGVDLIVEGLETPADIAAARAAGVAFGQGYALGRPRPAPLPGRVATAGGERPADVPEATAA